jgi:hypothetical protein
MYKLIFISVPRRLMVKRATGWRQFRAKAISPSCGSDSPTEAAINKSWKPGDIEKVN